MKWFRAYHQAQFEGVYLALKHIQLHRGVDDKQLEKHLRLRAPSPGR